MTMDELWKLIIFLYCKTSLVIVPRSPLTACDVLRTKIDTLLTSKVSISLWLGFQVDHVIAYS